MSPTPLSVKLNVLAISIIRALSLAVSAAGILTIDRLTNKLSDSFLRMESKRISNRLLALRDSGIRGTEDDIYTGPFVLSCLQEFDINHQNIGHLLASTPSV